MKNHIFGIIIIFVILPLTNVIWEHQELPDDHFTMCSTSDELSWSEKILSFISDPINFIGIFFLISLGVYIILFFHKSKKSK